MDYEDFAFYDPGKLIESELELVLVQTIFPEVNKIAYVPVCKFEMRISGTKQKLGSIDFRVGKTRNLIMYAGHFGYDVAQKYRGNRYAAKSCRLLFPLAKKHKINPVWITVNPDNIASRQTCEIAGGQLIEIVDLPVDNDQYQKGERQKCRYRFDL
ncbi:MAG: hypothetical protein QNJ72_10705 [Pleurocapsa sp. MO_226.B13]|nr:hypothetical protein [Pleurocapsa sp. MO_226.B13]